MSGDELARDQRTRRAGEIRAAALAYVRACGLKHAVLDIAQFGQRRWRQDGDIKRRIMVDAMIEDVRGGVPVVDVWRRFELDGRIAQRLVGASHYEALYDILDRNGMAAGFLPRDIAEWVWTGKMSEAEGMIILGIESPVAFENLLAGWLAGEN